MRHFVSSGTSAAVHTGYIEMMYSKEVNWWCGCFEAMGIWIWMCLKYLFLVFLKRTTPLTLKSYSGLVGEEFGGFDQFQCSLQNYSTKQNQIPITIALCTKLKPS
jgi:hypothetical protein